MARPGPEAAVAHPAAIGRLGGEGGQLSVGHGLSGGGDQGDGEAGEIAEVRPRPGTVRGKGDGRRQDRGHQGLDLQEPEQPRLQPVSPIPPQLLVSAVLGRRGHPQGDMQAKPDGPDRGDGGDHQPPSGGRTAPGEGQGHAGRGRAEGPEHVDPADVAPSLLPGPGGGHDQAKAKQGEDQAHGGPQG